MRYRYKVDSNVYIVDEDYFLEMEKIAKKKNEGIDKLAEEKFRAYLNDGMNPIKLEFRIRGVEELIGYSVVSELNYNERGYPMSVPEKIKYEIVDDIAGYVKKKFEYYKDDCRKVFYAINKENEERNKKKIRLWRSLFVITFILLLVECIYRII